MENFIEVHLTDGQVVYLNRDHIIKFNQYDEFEEFDEVKRVEFYTTLGKVVGVGLAEEYFQYGRNLNPFPATITALTGLMQP